MQRLKLEIIKYMNGKATETEHGLIGPSGSPRSAKDDELFAVLNPTAADMRLERLLYHRMITQAQYDEIVERERPLVPFQAEGGYLTGKRIKDVPPGDEIMDNWGG